MPPFPSAPPPQGLQQGPHVPPGLPFLTFDGFLTVNTLASRPAIGDKECAWLDGLMPIGPSNARTMPGVSQTKVYEDLSIATVLFDFGNIGTTPLMMVFKADGAVIQVNTNTLMTTTALASGTITNPSVNTIGMTQWGSKYLIIVTQQTNGYFVWDGSLLYRSGTLSPQITITNGGTGYNAAPTISFSGGSGSGAAAVATVANGIITQITMTNPGSGYVVGDTVTVTITPTSGGSGGAATVKIMPFGISGNCIETYQNRVWVGNGAEKFFSAPGSFDDFSTASGGGSFTSTNSFLRVGTTALKQSNGFLYMINDSSIDYISGVQTSGTPPTTTFTNQNADPEVGTPYGATVDTLGANIVFANAWGAHVSYGGKTAKVSDNMDGVYNSVPNFGGAVLSATKAILYGTRIWCLLVPLVDPVTGQQVNKLICWNGEKSWWTTEQDVNLVYVQHQEIDSVLTAYGSTGNTIYKLFQTPSIAFEKTAQSKLWANPGIQNTKGQNRLFGMVNYYSIESPEITVSIDNEAGPAPQSVTAGPAEMVWLNASNEEMTWLNASGEEMTWFSTGLGISIFDPQTVSQNGVLAGFTVQTNCADVSLIQFVMDNQDLGYRG